MDNVYLDYGATTPLDKDVLEKMEPYFIEVFGNPSSSHSFGQKAEFAVEESRRKIAKILDASEREVYFTGGGSEGDNLAIRGVVLNQRKTGKNEILTSPVEHSAVMNTVKQLKEDYEFNTQLLRIDNYGQIEINNLLNSINTNTAIVSIVYANNEVGTINPIHEIASICHERGVLFHTDAVQACAHLPIQFHQDGIDLLTFAAHKFYGPKGVGALLCRQGVELVPQITGGKQEHKWRAGTHNVPGIVGMAAALEIKSENMLRENERLSNLRDRIIDFVLAKIPGSYLTGHPTQRLPNHASFVFEGVVGNDLVIALDMAGFACSSGSACKVGDPKPSKILLALGIPPELAIGSLRVTLGRNTTPQQIDRFLEILPKTVEVLRKKK